RRDLLLVPESDRTKNERDSRQDSLLDQLSLHERNLHADVHPRNGGSLAPSLYTDRLRPRRSDAAAQRLHLLFGLGSRNRSALLHRQFFLEHEERGESRRQPLVRDDARMGRAFPSAAWKFRHNAGRL